MNRLLIFFSALLLLFVGSACFWFANQGAMGSGSASGSSAVEEDSDYVAPARELTEFEFVDQLAKPFSSKQLDGKVWMASFFFASCPGICVQQNAEVAKIHRRFKEEDVTILSISVQPKDDQPHVLLLYANRFDVDHAKWKFLTGKDVSYVQQVGAEFFALPAADTSHTSDLALFGPDGTMYGPYKVTDAGEQTKLIMKTEELLADRKKDEGPTEAAETDDEPSTLTQES